MAKPKPLKPLKDRISAADLKKIKERKLTNVEAAAKYGVSETYLCRVVVAAQGAKVAGQVTTARKAAAKLVAARRQTRVEKAKKVLAGDLTMAQAASQARCSVRTMERYVASYVPPKAARKSRAKSA